MKSKTSDGRTCECGAFFTLREVATQGHNQCCPDCMRKNAAFWKRSNLALRSPEVVERYYWRMGMEVKAACDRFLRSRGLPVYSSGWWKNAG